MVFKRFHGKEDEDEEALGQQEQEDDIDADDDSPASLEFFSNGQILRKILANILFSSKAGYYIKTRRGLMVALDTTDTPELYRLDLHGKTIAQFFIDLHAGGV